MLKFLFVVVATLIVLASAFFTNRLANRLSVEETKKIEIWAEATRQLVLADEDTDFNFLLRIIEDNTTIPVIMTDDEDNMLSYRNISNIPEKNVDVFFQKKIADFKSKKESIEVKLSDETSQYIYYDESSLLKQLHLFPFIQIGIIVVYFIIVIFVFASTKRAEQNQVWVGLSKETAHQLGTPISSLMAWTELLKAKYSDDKLIVDMEKDVNRLSVIAERFSKVGSKPDLKPTDLLLAITNALAYMRKRSSNLVEITLHKPQNKQILILPLNIPLFEWVIENLCKNAIDAMNGSGKIDIYLIEKDNNILIDVVDTGKGIERKMQKTIFSPGFTTKARGWGLGLSLAKRIIEEYHRGKIFVKHSEPNVGTTFRITLPKS